MKTVSSTIKFNGYTVDRLTFEPKTPAAPMDENENPSFAPVFTREITGYETGDCTINLTATVGQSDDNMPFTSYASITGKFHVPDAEHAKSIMEINGTAILFPYLRAVMTQLTSTANLPPVYLPTINLVDMLKENDKESAEITE